LTAGSINYHLMGNPLGPNMAQHFSSIFKPISSNDHQTRQGGVSLWMNQGVPQVSEALMGNNIQEIHQLRSATSSGAMFGDLLAVSCSHAPPSDHYQFNWPVFGNKISSNNAHEELTSTLVLPLTNVKEAAAASQLASVPSLYSTQQQQSHQTTSANMSATALLQKAAQIGATSTDPSFLGSFALKSNAKKVQDGNKFCGLYGSSPVSTNPASDVENSGSDQISSLNQLQMYPKRQKIFQSDQDSPAGGQTRDFLGVGVQAICHPSSINGWI